MKYDLKDVVYETNNYWVLNKYEKGYEVYKIGVTHSTRCAIIGYKGQEGLERAIAEAKRRELQDNPEL